MPIAKTSPPAKLNLFLEIPARRSDGFHEIDTVMMAIDLRDELIVETIAQPTVEMEVQWLPSREEMCRELGLDPTGEKSFEILGIPAGPSNLVHKALELTRQRLGIKSGFRVKLQKRIPAGAGMGGASSDAAHAISCAAQINQFDSGEEVDRGLLQEIASSIGSDVPFFLPVNRGASDQPYAAHATGRGEILAPMNTRTSIHFVVAYPPDPLSTAAVYGKLRVPENPICSSSFRHALDQNDRAGIARYLFNRLTEPAAEILPQLHELVESLWQSGLQPCQLTGSGSACFGIARDSEHAFDVVDRLKAKLHPGILLRVAESVPAAAPIEIEPS